MKKLLPFIVCMVAFVLSSCNLEIPEKVSIKTKAEYNFSMGSFEKEFSEYLSVETLTKEMNDDFTIYDYNPAKSSKAQQFMIDFPITDIPIDAGDALSNMDFSGKIEDLSFDQNINQTIEIPSMDTTGLPTVSVDFPDFNQKIRDNASFSGLSGVPVVDDVEVPVVIQAPKFTSMTFYSGTMDVKIENSDGAVVYLTSGSSSANAVVYSDVARIPLYEVTLSSSFTLKVTGAGGSASFSGISFSDDLKVKKVTGLTMDLDSDGTVEIDHLIDVVTDDKFIECTISDGKIEVQSRLPDGWENVAVTSVTTLSKGIVASDSEFKTVEGSGYLINRSLDLNGKTYTKGEGVDAGKIKFEGSVTFTLSDSTLVFSETESKIDTYIGCEVNKVSSVTINLKEIEDSLSLTVSEDFDTGSNALKSMTLEPSGFIVKYTNTLPEGNNIGISTYSDFFKIGTSAQPNTGTLNAGGAGSGEQSLEILGADDNEITVSDSTKVDIDISLSLPGDVAGHPEYAVLTNIDLGESYQLTVTMVPKFEWKQVVVDPSIIGDLDDEIDTGFSVNSIFSGLTDALGGDTEVAESIDFAEIPMYLYATMPNVSGLSDLSFEGSIKGKIEKENGTVEEEYLLPSQASVDDGTADTDDSGNPVSKLKLVSAVTELERDEDDCIISDLSTIPSSFEGADLADLINSHASGNLLIDYKFTVNSAGTTDGIVINKADLAGITNTSISLEARIVLPLSLTIKKDLTLDLYKLADMESDGDLFKRSEATDIDEVEKYIDVIDSVNVMYKLDNGIFNYTKTTGASSGVKVAFVNADPRIDEELVFGGKKRETFSLKTEDIKGILTKCPFNPTVEIQVPAGEFYIGREASFTADVALSIKTDGTVELFSK